jgi:hypothetical protein
MKRVSKSAISISVFACTAVLSFGWSEQGGVSFSVESAQARVGRPLTPVSVAGVARRHNRRAAYGYGVAGAAAVGTAGAVAAANAPYYSGWGNNTGGGWRNPTRKLTLTMGNPSTHTGLITDRALTTLIPDGTITRCAALLNALPVAQLNSTTATLISASRATYGSRKRRLFSRLFQNDSLRPSDSFI